MTTAVAQELDVLRSADLIRLASTDPDLEYIFRHALLQDAAYNLLLRGERQALHREVGTVLEREYPDRREELAAVLAYHFEQAEVWDRALPYLVLAGKQALKRFANREARDLLDRAAAHLEASDEDESPAVRVEVGWAGRRPVSRTSRSMRPSDSSRTPSEPRRSWMTTDSWPPSISRSGE
jgi:predicted ATPase